MKLMNVRNFALVALVVFLVGLVGTLVTYSSSSLYRWLTTGDFDRLEVLEERIVSNANFTDVEISLNSIRAEVVPTSDSLGKVTLEGNRARRQNSDVFVDVANGVLRIEVRDKGRFLNFDLDSFFDNQKLTIALPERVYRNLKVDVGSGVLNYSKLEFESATVEVRSGVFSMEDASVGDLKAKVNSGTMKLTDLVTVKTRFDVRSGLAKLTRVDGDLVGEVASGTARITSTNFERSMDIQVNSGLLWVKANEEPVNVRFDVTANSGVARVFGQKNYATVYGEGYHLIRLRANSGSVKVVK